MLPQELDALAEYTQFVLFRRIDKVPCDYRTGKVCDAQASDNWTDAETAYSVATSNPAYGVGFVLTDNDPFFVVDMDKCLQSDSTRSETALALIAALPGAAVEVSLSGKGLHCWGTYHEIPPHSCRNIALGIEIYHTQRYIAIGGHPGTTGNAATDCTTYLPSMIGRWFPPAATARDVPLDWIDAPTHPEWKGPVDDADALLILTSRKLSLAAVFGNGAMPADLLSRNVEVLARAYPTSTIGEPYDASSADAALASHLAWITGGNPIRMERMRQSALVRDKYERPDYLPRTILNAITHCSAVYGGRDGANSDEEAGTPEPLLKPVSIFDVLTKPSPPPAFIWYWYLPRGVVTLLSAHGGTGKSFIALMLAVCAALGRALFGVDTVQCNTVFASFEDGTEIVRHRLATICKVWGINPADLEGKLHIVDGTENPELFTADNRGAGETTATYAELCELVQSTNAGLVVVDNASDSFGGDEINRRQVRAFMRALVQVARLTNCAVLLLGHVDKGTSRARKAEGGEGYSGSTAWHNSSRSRLFMSRAENGLLTLEHQKHNLGGGMREPLTLTWTDNGLPMLESEAPDRTGLNSSFQGRADDITAAALMNIIAEYESRGQYCSPAITSRNNVFAVLKVDTEFKALKLHKDDCTRIVTKCQRAGWIEPMKYKDTGRKWHERWTLTTPYASWRSWRTTLRQLA
jgi:hypothetical protein